MMRTLISIALMTAALASPVKADVIASCGPMSGYSYFFPDEFFDGGKKDGEWSDGPLNSTTIFVGDNDVVTDVIISGEMFDEPWTRSASDYGAPVREVWREGNQRIVTVFWNGVVEVYLLDTEAKIASLAAQKIGLMTLTHVFAGPCE